jgi:hypothetical protein
MVLLIGKKKKRKKKGDVFNTWKLEKRRNKKRELSHKTWKSIDGPVWLSFQEIILKNGFKRTQKKLKN